MDDSTDARSERESKSSHKKDNKVDNTPDKEKQLRNDDDGGKLANLSRVLEGTPQKACNSHITLGSNYISRGG